MIKLRSFFARYFYSCLTFFSDPGYAPAPDSFLFSIFNKDYRVPFKSPLKDNMAETAICRYNEWGPTFGGGYDMRGPHDANKYNSYAQFGRTYQLPPGYTYQLPPGYTYGSPEAQSLLAGSLALLRTADILSEKTVNL